MPQAQENLESKLKTKRRFRLRFGLKALMVLCVLSALTLRFQSSVKEQREVVDRLLQQGAKIHYDYQLDSDGNEIPNANIPGPELLTDLLGVHWFCVPVSVSGDSLDFREVGKLAELRYLNLSGSYAGKENGDLRSLSRLQKLKSLSLRGYLRGTDGLAELSRLESLTCDYCYLKQTFVERGDQQSLFASVGNLKQLHTVDIHIDNTLPKEERDLDPLGNLSKLRVLKLAIGRYSWDDQYDLSWVGELEELETVRLVAGDWKPITQLKRLRNLSVIGTSENFHPRDFANCTGLESLEIRQCPIIEDVQWVSKLTKLKSLKVTPYWSTYCFEIKDTSPLHNLKELETLDLPNFEIGFELDLLKSTRLSLANTRGYRRHRGFDMRLSVEKKRLDLAHSDIRNLDLVPDDILLEDVLLQDNSIQDISKIAKQTELKLCDLSDNPITDVTALANTRKLVSLDLHGCPVKDISALENCNKLDKLVLSGTKVRDLPDFVGKITNLNLSDTPLESFHSSATGRTPGTGFSTNDCRVDLSRTRVKDLAKLPTHFNRVKLAGTDVSDLSALKDWKNIIVLDLSGTKVRDLSTLPTLPHLEELDLSRTELSNLSGIERLPKLRQLKLADTQVADLSPLTAFQSLGLLDVSGTKVKDLDVLAQVRLHDLSLNRTQVVDLSPLKNQVHLGALELADTQVADLGPLRDLGADNAYEQGIKSLVLSRTRVTSLDTLGEFKWLGHLDISGTDIKSLDGFSCYTQRFYALDCPQLKLESHDLHFGDYVSLDCTAIDDLSVLQGLASLRRLTLQNLKPSHKLDWLADVPDNISLRLTIAGPPIELDVSSFDIRFPPHFCELRLPVGSRVTPELRKKVHHNAKIRFGDAEKNE